MPVPSAPLAKLYWSLLATTALAAALAVASFWLSARNQSENGWVRHTLEVRSQLAEVLNLVQGVETAQRGYLLTGRDPYLAPFESATEQLPTALDHAADLVSDNPQQRQALAQLRLLVTEKLKELRSTIDDRRAGNTAAALAMVETDAGLKIMTEIRKLIGAMEAEEVRLLQVRENSSAASRSLLNAGVASAFLLICVIGALISYFTRRSFAELANARDQLLMTNQKLRDQISQREEVESALRQAQKMEAIGQLTGGIAHDFNNMLGVIAGSLDLMRRRIRKGDFAVERFVEAASKATERAASLTNRLLAFARQQPLAPQPIDANKMIASMSDLLHSTLGEHIQIETVTAAGLWTTSADAHQLESAILNIAINARDAMPEGGKLTIETGNAYLDEAYCDQHAEVKPGQFVLIAISDNGTGMPPEVIARAFDPFFTTKEAGKGTGLGLSQVYGFIKQSSGHIKIYSESGAGTTVKIYLPRLVGEPKEVSRTLEMPPKAGDAGEVILVVEDDPLMRRHATEALTELGYTVLDCEGAADALAILDRTPDIKMLFTDVVMPVVNGRKLAEQCLRRRPHLKVLFTTGYTPNAVVHGGVLDPGVAFLGKPFTLEQLAAKVRAILDQ